MGSPARLPAASPAPPPPPDGKEDGRRSLRRVGGWSFQNCSKAKSLSGADASHHHHHQQHHRPLLLLIKPLSSLLFPLFLEKGSRGGGGLIPPL